MRRITPTAISSLLVGAWATLAGVIVGGNFPFIRSLELQTQSLFFNLRGTVAPPPNLVVLAIDDDSLTRGRDSRDIKELAPIASWPWRRSAYAVVIDRLMQAGARAVAVDVVFDLPSDYPKDDQKLQAVLQKYAGRVTLAAFYASSETTAGGLDQLVYPDPMFQTQPQSIGLVNFLTEADGQFRRFTSAYLDQIDPDLRRSQPQLVPFDQASLQAARLPFAPPKGNYLFFYGGQNTFPTLSFWHVLYPRNWAVMQKQEIFKDKLVLIGPTAGVLQDIRSTPFGEMPGVEIHANAIATLLQGRAIGELMPDARWRGILVFLGVAAIGWGLRWVSRRSALQSLAALGIAIVWLGIGYFSFTYGGLILPVVVPAVAIALVGLSYLAVGAVSDQLEKLKLRRTFERYVSPPIVQEILNQPEDFQTLLQGRNLHIAVLFCDIRGFTTLSYKLSPQQLVTQLNTYLNAMVEAITANRGTIDKFIGDAVMAEFGSPVSQGPKNDAMSAIRAALAMRQALADLRQQWQQEGKMLLYNGIGISFGEVIAGNIGSLKRLEYTVIGDAVNVASRVEGLTKSFQVDILITGPLYDLVQDEIEVVPLGEHPLRGREESLTRLYSVVGLKGQDQTLYQQVQEGLHQYLGAKQKQG